MCLGFVLTMLFTPMLRACRPLDAEHLEQFKIKASNNDTQALEMLFRHYVTIDYENAQRYKKSIAGHALFSIDYKQTRAFIKEYKDMDPALFDRLLQNYPEIKYE